MKATVDKCVGFLQHECGWKLAVVHPAIALQSFEDHAGKDADDDVGDFGGDK